MTVCEGKNGQLINTLSDAAIHNEVGKNYENK